MVGAVACEDRSVSLVAAAELPVCLALLHRFSHSQPAARSPPAVPAPAALSSSTVEIKDAAPISGSVSVRAQDEDQSSAVDPVVSAVMAASRLVRTGGAR